MMQGYYSEKELKRLGLKSYGENILISKKASLYMPEKISLGNNIRIDDFCLLVGDITLGDYVCIHAYASIHGTGGGSVTLKGFCGLASYATIYAGSGDYSGEHMTGPFFDSTYHAVETSDIVMEKHSGLCLRSILLPGAYMAEGTILSAGSVLAKCTKPWYVYHGNPARRTLERKRGAAEEEKLFLKEQLNNKET